MCRAHVLVNARHLHSKLVGTSFAPVRRDSEYFRLLSFFIKGCNSEQSVHHGADATNVLPLTQ